MTVIDKLRNYWQAEQFDQLAGSYSSDALLDIYVPAGRMQYRRLDHPSRCVLHRRLDLHGSPALGARSGH